MKLEKDYIEDLGWKQLRIFENDSIIEHMYIIDNLGHDTLDNIQLQIIWLKIYPNKPDCVMPIATTATVEVPCVKIAKTMPIKIESQSYCMPKLIKFLNSSISWSGFALILIKSAPNNNKPSPIKPVIKYW